MSARAPAERRQRRRAFGSAALLSCRPSRSHTPASSSTKTRSRRQRLLGFLVCIGQPFIERLIPRRQSRITGGGLHPPRPRTLAAQIQGLAESAVSTLPLTIMSRRPTAIPARERVAALRARREAAGMARVWADLPGIVSHSVV